MNKKYIIALVIIIAVITITGGYFLYKYWQKEGIIIPIYSIVAKGEMGINPNLDKLNIKYSVYETEVLNGKIRLGKKIDLKISPDMINKSDAVTR